MRSPLTEPLKNVYVDTCVYHRRRGIDTDRQYPVRVRDGGVVRGIPGQAERRGQPAPRKKTQGSPAKPLRSVGVGLAQRWPPTSTCTMLARTLCWPRLC